MGMYQKTKAAHPSKSPDSNENCMENEWTCFVMKTKNDAFKIGWTKNNFAINHQKPQKITKKSICMSTNTKQLGNSQKNSSKPCWKCYS